MPRVALTLLVAALTWTVWSAGGVDLADFAPSVLLISAAALLVLARPAAPRLPRTVSVPLAVLTFWPALQLIPLPLDAVQALSPARAELASALALSHTALAVNTSAALAEWLRLAASVLTLLTVRELAWRFSDRRTPWLLALPPVALALLEAALGLAQFSPAPGARSQGTFTNPDHYSAFLEMLIAAPLLWAVAVLGRTRRRDAPLGLAMQASAAFGATALLLAGSLVSLSRLGFVSALFAVAVALWCLAPPHRAGAAGRLGWILAIPALALAIFIWLPPDQLVARFGEMSTAEGLTLGDRWVVWNESMPLLGDYLLTGTGLGGFESAFMRHKRSTPLLTDNYAHNDWLQYCIELGLAVWLIGLFLTFTVVRAATRSAFAHPTPSGRALAAAALSGIAAVLLHSVGDFNTYIPANSLTISWISALALSAEFSARPVIDASRAVLDITAS